MVVQALSTNIIGANHKENPRVIFHAIDCEYLCSTGGLPQSSQVGTPHSLTARRCMANERQMKDQGK